MAEKKRPHAGLTRRQILSGGIVAGSAAAFAGQASQARTIEGECRGSRAKRMQLAGAYGRAERWYMQGPLV